MPTAPKNQHYVYLLKVRAIGASKHKSAKFATFLLYFSGKNNAGQLVFVTLKCEIYLVEELWVILLIGNNILSLESVVIDISGRKALIKSCRVKTTINTKQQRQFFAKKLCASQKTVVLSYSKAMVFLYQVFLLDNWDFFFHCTIQTNLTLYSYIVNHETSKVLVKNASEQLLRILQCHKLGYLLDITYNKCFLVDTQFAHNLAVFSLSSKLF